MIGLRTHTSTPEVPTGYPLDDVKLYKIEPEAGQNLCINPSLERGSFGWIDGQLSDTRSFRGSFSYYGTSAGNSAVTYVGDGGTIGLIGPTPITVSLWLWTISKKVSVYTQLYDDGEVSLISPNYTFFGPSNCWQYYKKTFLVPDSSILKRVEIAIGALDPPDWTYGTVEWWVDAVQIENKSYATTYLDGDQKPYVRGQRAYYWQKEPHRSYSFRTADTNTGGQWKAIDLDSHGFTLKAILGAGYAQPSNNYTPVALKPGSVFQRVLAPPSIDFDLIGEISSPSLNGLFRNRKGLVDMFRFNRTPSQQPLTIALQRYDCAESSCLMEIPTLYRGGLEGALEGYYNERLSLGFTNISGYFCRSYNDTGKEIVYQDLFAEVNGIMRRDSAGTWDDLETGCNNVVYAIAEAPNGDIYVGGAFTDAGGTGADYLAKYTPSTNTWSVVKSATAFDNIVYTLKFDAGGLLYIGGQFTVVDAVANTQGVCTYDIATNTFAAVGTGTNGTVRAIEIMSNGDVYLGGAFTDGSGTGADNLFKWVPSTATASTVSSATAFNNSVLALQQSADGVTLYIGGSFTDAGTVPAADRICTWDGTSIAALGAGADNDVNALELGPDGTLYIGGDFATLASVACARVCGWNGTRAYPLGVGLNGSVETLTYSDGLLYAGGGFTGSGTLTFIERAAVWVGTSWVPLTVDFNSGGFATGVFSFCFPTDGSMYVGFSATQTTAITPHVQTLTNGGNGNAYPRFVVRGPGTLWEIKNYTTGQSMYFKLTILPHEYVTIDLDPFELKISSNFRANLIGSVLPGSEIGTWKLAPGDNSVSVFMTDNVYETGDTNDALSDWRIRGVTAINSDDFLNGVIGTLHAVYAVAGPQATVALYRDEGLVTPDALSGLELISASNVEIVESGSSGVSGYVDFNTVALDDDTIQLVVGLMNVYWRNTHLSADSLVD